MNGEYYTFTDEELPKYTGCQNVFGVGNVVTGQGNIRVSLVHSQKVTNHLIETYMGIGNRDGSLSGLYAAAESVVAGQAKAIEEKIEKLPAAQRQRSLHRSKIASNRCSSERATPPTMIPGLPA